MPYTNNQVPPDIVERINQLEAKYEAMGQDLRSYLDGLLYDDFLTYWDYINLDVLLNLQHPITPFKDEMVFIIYHQITELYFKLTINALKEITEPETAVDATVFTKYLQRVNSYFDALIKSFEIMVAGMDKEQFLKFRMSLLPASGFQSAQYRLIEIYATDLDYLISPVARHLVAQDATLPQKYEFLYWKQGANELATGKKTLTLRQFEQKYNPLFLETAQKYAQCNIWQTYLKLPETERNHAPLTEQLRLFDHNANVLWPLMHFKSAVRYLQREPKEIAATGGTNWQKYLPPKNQGIIFFPDLWTEEEKLDWGKKAQMEVLAALMPHRQG